MKKNSLTVFEYVSGVMIWGFVTMVWYEQLVFTPLPGMSMVNSYRLYLIMTFGLLIINLAITIKWYRNILSAVASILVPIGVYTCFAYTAEMPVLFKTVLIIAGILSIAYLIYAALAPMMYITPRKAREIRIKKSFVVVRGVIAFACIILIVCTTVKVNVPHDLFRIGSGAQFKYSDEYKLDNNMDTVRLLADDEWKKLTTSERVEVLQCISHIEGRYLGLTHEVAVQVKVLEENVAGCYNHGMSTLYISPMVIARDSSHDALEAVCHEMFHAAQHRYVEIYESLDEDAKKSFFVYDASVYAEEFENYDDGDKRDGYESYLNQKCEQDARKYAQTSVEDYYQSIREASGQ